MKRLIAACVMAFAFAAFAGEGDAEKTDTKPPAEHAKKKHTMKKTEKKETTEKTEKTDTAPKP